MKNAILHCGLISLVCSMGNIAYASEFAPESIWLNSGFWSHHFEKDRNFRDNNYGIGLQAAFSPSLSANGGVFRNSDDVTSHYLGTLWQPYSLGYVKMGVWAGGLNGYPRMREGGWFVAAFPMASLEYQRVGLNLTIMPTYKDKLHGAVVAQLKLKIW